MRPQSHKLGILFPLFNDLIGVLVNKPFFELLLLPGDNSLIGAVDRQIQPAAMMGQPAYENALCVEWDAIKGVDHLPPAYKETRQIQMG